MKKFFFMAVAVLTLGLASCGENKGDDAAAVIESLKTQLEAGDASGVQTTLQAAQAKIAELVAQNPEAAKTYVTKIQDFVKENKEKITAVVGDNLATQTLVQTLVDTPAETVISTLTAGQSVIDNANQAAQDIQDAAQQAVDEQVNAAQEAAQEQAEAAKEAVNQKVDEAKQQAVDEVNKAAGNINDKVNEAKDGLLKGAGLK